MSKLINSPDPRLHSLNVQSMLTELVDHLQFDVTLVNEPRFQALLETSREVLKGLRRAYQDFDQGQEKGWGGSPPEST